ncbi:MAG: SAM-dependent methyltransferase [Bacteroidota bacterium]
MKKGQLILIPTVVSEDTQNQVLSQSIFEACGRLDYFAVENVRTSRRFISTLKLGRNIEEIDFRILNKDTPDSELGFWVDLLLNGSDVGLMSESGCPGIADPGSKLVKAAHQKKIKVIPLVGPSSIFLALMASGFNGQSFVFHGYVPIDKKEKRSFIQRLEKDSRTHQTQIFMDTPYRNNQLFETLMTTCQESTMVCIARDITGNDEMIASKTVKEWKGNPPDLHKMPTIFLLYSN